MSTVLSVYHSGGEAGRCDANCHEAKEPACDCCCGGRFHGCGSSERAIELNTEDFFGSLEAAQLWAKRNQVHNPQIKAPGVLSRRRSLARVLEPYRVAERRQLRLGIVPGQTSLAL